MKIADGNITMALPFLHFDQINHVECVLALVGSSINPIESSPIKKKVLVINNSISSIQPSHPKPNSNNLKPFISLV